MSTKSDVWITTHEGKMSGIRSISTNPLSNTFCKTMHGCGNTDMICTHCYATQLVRFRRSLWEHMEANSELLSKAVLIPSVLPKYDDKLMRFNSFGEIVNANHLINIFSICNANPQTQHVIYSKRMNLIEQFHCFIPKNLIIVESNPLVDDVKYSPKSWAADYVFNVVSEKGADPISCIKSCDKCRKCYTPRKNGQSKCIVELLK